MLRGNRTCNEDASDFQTTSSCTYRLATLAYVAKMSATSRARGIWRTARQTGSSALFLERTCSLWQEEEEFIFHKQDR